MATSKGSTEPIEIGEEVSPSVSILDGCSGTEEAHPRRPARHVRLLIRRFLVGRLYRHRRYWYARVEDLRTGRRFRMSSGEKERKKAEEGLKRRLELARNLDDVLREGAEEAENTPGLQLQLVEDENYHLIMEAAEGLRHLVERGRDVRNAVREVLEEQQPSRPPSPLFEDAFEEFLKNEKKGVKPKTLQDFRYAHNRYYLPALGGKSVDDVKHRDVKGLLNQFVGTRKARTHNYHRATLNAFFNYCLRNDYCLKNPVEGIKRLREEDDERKGKPLTVDQCRALLRAARTTQEKTVKARRGRRRGHSWKQTWEQPEWRFLALLLSLHTGLRQGNVVGKNALLWKEVDLDERKISIPKKKVKNKREIEIPIHPELLEVLRALPRGKPTEPVVKGAAKDIDRAWKTVCRLAGLLTGEEGYLWKDLRTTFSTRLVDADMPESVNESLMGHSRGKVVNRRYALATWEKKVEAIRKLPRLLEDPSVLSGEDIPKPPDIRDRVVRAHIEEGKNGKG